MNKVNGSDEIPAELYKILKDDAVKVLYSKVLVAQSYQTLESMDYSTPAPVHGILQARILKWVAIPFSMRSSQPEYQTLISCTAGKFFTI